MRKRHIAPILTVAIVTAFLTMAANASAGDIYDYNTHYYKIVDTDDLTFKTQNNRAKVSGGIAWLVKRGDDGDFSDQKRRATYGRRAKVRAIKPVGCLWARVHFYYPDTSYTVATDGVAVTVDGKEEAGPFGRRCRKPGQRRPKPLSLGGIGFPHSELSSSIVEFCTSRSPRQTPRQCTFEKNSFLKQ